MASAVGGRGVTSSGGRRITVVGCGAMGSVYAARLAAAGNSVWAVSRNQAHMERVAERGLVISGPDGERTASLAGAGNEVPEEPMDMVILAVKAADVERAAGTLGPLLTPTTAVVTIQNGLGSAELVAAAVGPERVIVGVASGFGASLPAPGTVHYNAMKAVRFGAYDPSGPNSLEDATMVWAEAGFDAAAVEDILAMQWEKLTCNAAYSAPCALSGLRVGEVMDHPQLGAVSRSAATEAWATARARGVAVGAADPVALVRAFAAGMPQAKPSALLDHEAHRASEIPVINGAVVREAARAGLSAPVNDTLTRLILTREQQWR